MSQIPDLKKLYNLQPGQRAMVEVELLNSSDEDGVVAAICGVSRIEKRSREEYFRIHSITRVWSTQNGGLLNADGSLFDDSEIEKAEEDIIVEAN